uniref:Uncharacterized protein n=1 Tax=Lactuca sativa TaxID=4236 RepID=A0A9R1VT19_LACSA|nr:hypothetical protein LSAT_V11C400166950 [Lactuca sativa]
MNSDVNVSPDVVAVSVLVILLIRFFTGHKKDDKDQVEFIAGKTSLGDAVDREIKIFTVAICHDCCCCGSRRTSIGCHINAGILDVKNDVGYSVGKFYNFVYYKSLRGIFVIFHVQVRRLSSCETMICYIFVD